MVFLTTFLESAGGTGTGTGMGIASATGISLSALLLLPALALAVAAAKGGDEDVPGKSSFTVILSIGVASMVGVAAFVYQRRCFH